MTRKRKLISPYHKEWRRYDPVPSILEEWYGKEVGSTEIISHLPDAVPIQMALDDLMKGPGNDLNVLFIRIKDGWKDIVGEDIAAVAAPKSLKNGILYVEVENSAWLMELRNYSRKMMVEKLESTYGKDSIRDIVFVPSG